VRLDSAAHLLADIDQGIVRKIFTCPAQLEPQPAVMIGSYPAQWFGPLVPTTTLIMRGVLGFEGTITSVCAGTGQGASSSAIILYSDAVPRADVDHPFIAWSSAPEGARRWRIVISTPRDRLRQPVRPAPPSGLSHEHRFLRRARRVAGD